MTNLQVDILQRLELDFKDLADSALKILLDAVNKTDYLENDRIIRCIIFLAKGNIEKLKSNIYIAKGDPRDIMLYAEYENLDDNEFKYKRVRDFNKTFDKCTEDIQE